MRRAGTGALRPEAGGSNPLPAIVLKTPVLIYIMKIAKVGNFSEWYSKILFDAEIVDIRYPVKGMPVYMPWGFRGLDYFFRELEKLLDKNGHDKLLFPVAIPESIFNKEAEHIKGFSDGVLWITHGGETELEDKLVLRPTSETSMYPIFALWVRSHEDMPLKVYQTTTVYRHETKATRPLIRGREIYWNEAHTVHATFEDAAKQVDEAVKIYSEFFAMFGIPFLVIKRPDHDKFPGAEYTYALDTLMPDGRSLQIGTVHHLGEKFARAYSIKYSNENGEKRYANQTSYGISMRGFASVLGVHGDEKGLRLPFVISPVQIVFVPIYAKGNNEEVDGKLRAIYEQLSKSYRCVYDDKNKRPGDKFYYWEMKGVPLRVEAGMRDLSAGKVTLTDRVGNKNVVDIAVLESEIPRAVKEYEKRLFEEARAFFDSHISDADGFRKVQSVYEEKNGFIRTGWCGSMECVERLKEEAFDVLGTERGREGHVRKCVICGKEGKEVIIGKPY